MAPTIVTVISTMRPPVRTDELRISSTDAGSRRMQRTHSVVARGQTQLNIFGSYVRQQTDAHPNLVLGQSVCDPIYPRATTERVRCIRREPASVLDILSS